MLRSGNEGALVVAGKNEGGNEWSSVEIVDNYRSFRHEGICSVFAH